MYAPDICIYHSPCLDGFGAAWAVSRRWSNCQFVPASYDKPIEVDVDGRNVLFVDFSAPAETLQAMVTEGGARSIIVIDHHKSAQAALAGLPTFDSGYAIDSPYWHESARIVVYFDMAKSGARMAWEFAHSGEPVPEMIALIEDRDLWCFTYGDRSKQFCAALGTIDTTFATWDWANTHVDQLVDEGISILRSHLSNVQKFMAEVYTGDLCGFTVPFLNVPGFYASEAGHAMLNAYPDAPFVATWFRRADGLLQFSLRSEDYRRDVSEIAKQFGGGGHRNAAGFSLIVYEAPEHGAV